MLFALAGQQPQAVAVLAPEEGNSTVPGVADLPSYGYFPRSGCYALEARWPTGGWRMVFAVGR